MKKVLVTGSNGFIGKNLIQRLKLEKDVLINTFTKEDDLLTLQEHLKESDIIYHLAGVNRPQNIEEFTRVNVDLTEIIVNTLQKLNKKTTIIFTSSTQAELDNPYGKSKKKAEETLKEYNALTDARVCIYRLPNVFGKWCRPNYNSVVATFCFNISRGLDITISASNKEIELVYIDDVVESFIGHLNLVGSESRKLYYAINRSFKITLGDLVRRIHEIKDIRKTLVMPDLSDNFTKFLYATYLSYLDKDNFSYAIDTHRDERGSLVELIKSNHFGQIFVSTSQEGLMRGNYYHNSKVEKFCVIKGNAAIRFRKLNDDEVITYYVSERKMEVVDIPPGYTYSIENLAEGELIVLLWVNEVFSLEKPDTFPLNATENGGI